MKTAIKTRIRWWCEYHIFFPPKNIWRRYIQEKGREERKKDKIVLEQYAKTVLQKTKLEGWKMLWTKCPDGYCNHESKTFRIPERMILAYDWVAKEYVLHEVAHALSGEEGNRHGKVFYEKYAMLLVPFIGELVVKK